jgi:methionyl-tRNA synthetase
MLMSLGEPVPESVFAHGWWVSGGKKMSKSLGNFIGLDELRRVTDYYGLDTLRYYLLRAAPFGSDLDWQFDELHKSYLELANVLGNGLNRVLKMIGKYRDCVLPSAGAAGEPTNLDRSEPSIAGLEADLLMSSSELEQLVTSAYRELSLQNAVLYPVELVRKVNVYIDKTEPFKLAKDESQRARLDAVLANATIAIYRALVALLPVLPEKAAVGLAQLGVDPAGRTLADLMARPPQPGHVFSSGEPLFPRKDPLPEQPPE